MPRWCGVPGQLGGIPHRAGPEPRWDADGVSDRSDEYSTPTRVERLVQRSGLQYVSGLSLYLEPQPSQQAEPCRHRARHSRLLEREPDRPEQSGGHTTPVGSDKQPQTRRPSSMIGHPTDAPTTVVPSSKSRWQCDVDPDATPPASTQTTSTSTQQTTTTTTTTTNPNGPRPQTTARRRCNVDRTASCDRSAASLRHLTTWRGSEPAGQLALLNPHLAPTADDHLDLDAVRHVRRELQ